MAVTYLTTGATDLKNAANWSDGIGIADDAQCVIRDGSQNITTNLNTNTLTTTGVDFFHIMEQFTGSIGTGGTSLQMDFDATYTAKPNFLHRGAGAVYLDPETTLGTALLDGVGQLWLTGGTTTNMQVVRGTFNASDQATVTNLYVYGPGSARLEDSATIVVALVYVGGAGNVYIGREATTITVDGPGSVVINAEGETITTLNIDNPNATVTLVAGNVTTANVRGTLDLSLCATDSTVGGTATNLYPTGRILGDGNQRVTVSNITRIAGGSFAGAAESGA